MKNPDPDPSGVSTRTTAGIELPMTSSIEPPDPGVAGGVVGAGAGVAAGAGAAAGVEGSACGAAASGAAVGVPPAGSDTLRSSSSPTTGTATSAGFSGAGRRECSQYNTPATAANASTIASTVALALLLSLSALSTGASPERADSAAASSASSTCPQRHVATRAGTRRPHAGHFQLNAGE